MEIFFHKVEPFYRVRDEKFSHCFMANSEVGPIAADALTKFTIPYLKMMSVDSGDTKPLLNTYVSCF